MIPLIRRFVFAGNPKNPSAPQIFVVLCVYTVIMSLYTGLYFETKEFVMRVFMSLALTAAYVLLERSPLGRSMTAFLSSVAIMGILTFGAVYFHGDFLLFTYSSGVAMIVLTYLRPKALAAYTAVMGAAFAVLMLVFGVNLLGPSFSMIHRILYYIASVCINLLLYVFCKSYSLTLEALTEAKNEAHLASEAKGTFLSTMSHEIRTPMNAIIGMTNIGVSSQDIERKHYALVKIEEASAHLLGIINDVLDMSKIESGKFELSLEEFSFEAMLQRVVSVVSLRVDEKKLNFKLHIDKNIPRVLLGDDQRLAQVITNLLGNAVKFTPAQGSLGLDTRLVKEEEGLCTIQIQVSDSGIGISPEQQARLFQSFQQAEASTSRKYGGTGLGLTISKNIVEMMGGRIWVESVLGEGATFAFTVKVRRCASQAGELLARQSDWKGLHILAVDDDMGILGYLKGFVEESGAQCDIATSAGEALGLARQHAYDVCFIDWKMPDMDGFDLARELRAGGAGRDGQVVMMLATVDWSDMEERAKEAGVAKFLPKPLFPSAIEQIIDGFLGVLYHRAQDAGKQGLSFQGRRILLAEDVEINREIVLALLEPTHIEIDCAQDGAQALDMYQRAPEIYDAILMDVQMPEMDGYEATRRIRALDAPCAKTIPIIAMTANVFREDIEKCLAVGMNDHIGKPINIDQVQEKLRKYL